MSAQRKRRSGRPHLAVRHPHRQVARLRGQVVSPESAAKLHERTQGWAAGLVLLLEHSRFSGRIAELPGFGKQKSQIFLALLGKRFGDPIVRGVATIATLVGLVVAVGIVILLTVVPRLLEWLGVSDLGLTTGSLIADWFIAIALVFLGVRWILRHAPNRAQPVAWTSRGAWAATLGIAAVTIGVGIYARFSTSLSAAVLVFGTAVVILLWLYLCFVALLWGAIIEADDVRRRTTSADPRPIR